MHCCQRRRPLLPPSPCLAARGAGRCSKQRHALLRAAPAVAPSSVMPYCERGHRVGYCSERRRPLLPTMVMPCYERRWPLLRATPDDATIQQRWCYCRSVELLPAIFQDAGSVCRPCYHRWSAVLLAGGRKAARVSAFFSNDHGGERGGAALVSRRCCQGMAAMLL
ncbi:hypothetical protein QYE76_014197 [Lolium multiflorum]|uniref:Uncharacterized protein n=1 Tax=Lolium multiflorum TaxID=4521 RepID=A0AAD8U4H2_LOLMU|nr:hypothetical protein QYE76_014197 [Lolium multiflorum]